MTYLDDAQLDAIREAFNNLIEDSNVGSLAATYYARSTDGDDVDFSTGVMTDEVAAESIKVLLRPIDNEQAAGGQVGDAMVLVDQAQLSAEPDVSDSILVDGTRYQVVDVKEDITHTLWLLAVTEEASS